MAKVLPRASMGKYSSLVKHNSCIIILDIPDEAFSLNSVPINIPQFIKNNDIIIDTGIARSKKPVNFSPSKHAESINKISWQIIIGIIDKVYPIMYSVGLIGLTFNLINSDVFLSFDTSKDVNIVINDKLNIIIPGVKFSNL